MVFRSPSSLTLVSTIFCTSLSFETSASAMQDFRPLSRISLATPSAMESLPGISLTQTS